MWKKKKRKEKGKRTEYLLCKCYPFTNLRGLGTEFSTSLDRWDMFMLIPFFLAKLPLLVEAKEEVLSRANSLLTTYCTGCFALFA